MQCFRHPDRAAVGTCLACQRGLCHECACEVEQALACRDRCELEVRRTIHTRAWAFRQRQLQIKYWWYRRAWNAGLGAYCLIVGLVIAAVAYQEHFASLVVLGASVTTLGLFLAAGGLRGSAPERLRACPTCGYNLTGNTSGRCPECGTVCATTNAHPPRDE